VKWVGFWLRCLALAWLIGLAVAWFVSLATNVVYRGHFWVSLREVNELVAGGESTIFLAVAAYSIFWLAQIVREARGFG
jgi:hypothetical protein